MTHDGADGVDDHGVGAGEGLGEGETGHVAALDMRGQ